MKTCQKIFIFRNLFAEKAVTFMTIPCEFRTYGCRVEIQYKDKEVVSPPSPLESQYWSIYIFSLQCLISFPSCRQKRLLHS